MDSANDARPRPRIFLLSIGGFVLSWAAFLSYILLAPRWADLRDSGRPNEALALAGLGLGLWGLLRAIASRRLRTASAAFLAAGVLGAGFLIAFIEVLSYQVPPPSSVVAVGSPAPAFRLRDQDGRERSLEDFAGRKVFLIFFRGHW